MNLTAGHVAAVCGRLLWLCIISSLLFRAYQPAWASGGGFGLYEPWALGQTALPFVHAHISLGAGACLPPPTTFSCTSILGMVM